MSRAKPQSFGGAFLAHYQGVAWLKNANGHRTRQRHEFAINKIGESRPFERNAELYFCIRCGWEFLVKGRWVAALDTDGEALDGEGGRSRVGTFADGPCPALAVMNGGGERPEYLH